MLNNNNQLEVFLQYFKFQKTTKENWYELDFKNETTDMAYLSAYIKSITWVELIQTRVCVLQMNELNKSKMTIRFAPSEKDEKYWIGKMRDSENVSFLLLEDNKNNVIELFFTEKFNSNYKELLELFQSGELKKEIEILRK